MTVERDPMTVEPENTPNAERQPRSCNRHFDCDKAEQEVMTRTGKQKWEIRPDFHCHNDECEECFGY